MEKEKYLDGVKNAGKEASQVVREATHEFIEKEHILIGICKNKCTPLETVSRKFSINLDRLQSQIHRMLPSLYRSGYPDGGIHRSPECHKVFAYAEKLAGSAKGISCLHLLVAILDEPGDTISEVLQQMKVDTKKLRKYVLRNSTCTNRECGSHRVLPTLYFQAMAQRGALYIDEYRQDLTQTRAGMFEIILGAFCSLFLIACIIILGFFLPEDFILKIPHLLHVAVISTFILLFGAAEGYYVISETRKNKEISKVIRHVLINMIIFSTLIVGLQLVYKWFIAPK